MCSKQVAQTPPEEASLTSDVTATDMTTPSPTLTGSDSQGVAIRLKGVGKKFYQFERPVDRLLLQLPMCKKRARYNVMTGLQPIDLTIYKGEVVGLVGRNGAGKSTLLQLVCGTLQATSGELTVNGKIAALLELGSGFNPEFSGRENVYMAGAIAGLTRSQIDERFDAIHRFSGIGNFIDQPVKTYSSGMYVRLAFSVAVTVDPDILVVDEALSVGDGAFSRKSFDRIMALKEAGKTILFCSHNHYQIEAICNRAIWLHQGGVAAEGSPAEVVNRYERYLYSTELDENAQPEIQASAATASDTPTPRLTGLNVRVNGETADMREIPTGNTGTSLLEVEAHWEAPLDMPCPSLAVTVHASDGRMVGSAGSHIDQVTLHHEAGQGRATLQFPELALLKGDYWVEVYLLCDQGIMFYDQRVPAARFRIKTPGFSLEQGLVHLPRRWC